jgi:hypothetical protein
VGTAYKAKVVVKKPQPTSIGGGVSYRPVDYVAKWTVEAGVALGVGIAYETTVRLDWPLDEELLGLTDEQLVG